MSTVSFAPTADKENTILTPECVTFLVKLFENFNNERLELLEKRKFFQKALDEGALPSFLKETEHIRNSKWTVAPIPKKLQNRTIEITGPVDRKMIINALNSDADGFMADFEDATAPTWDNLINGQINLRDAINNKISVIHSTTGKSVTLKDEFKKLATLNVRPRGLHLNEAHFLVNGQEMSGSLFDFGTYFFTNGRKLAELEAGPYFYLPKLESHEEARWWNKVFEFSQKYVGLPVGTIRATVLVETILLAFRMDEVLYELRDHSAGLNCGRWDYIFSFIKKLHRTTVLPDKTLVTMKTPFMESYVKLLVETCHKRGIHAMGGMAAQIPVRGNDELNKKNMEAVYQDKLGEARNGMDGTWVAHPGLIPIARKAFETVKPANKANQIEVQKDYKITQFDLLQVPSGPVSLDCVKDNVVTCLQYLDHWLKGLGAVAINHKMEDAATAEISRTQLWNWINHRYVRAEVVQELIEKETSVGDTAKKIMKDIVLCKDLTDFMILEAYPYLKSSTKINPKL